MKYIILLTSWFTFYATTFLYRPKCSYICIQTSTTNIRFLWNVIIPSFDNEKKMTSFSLWLKFLKAISSGHHWIRMSIIITTFLFYWKKIDETLISIRNAELTKTTLCFCTVQCITIVLCQYKPGERLLFRCLNSIRINGFTLSCGMG